MTRDKPERIVVCDFSMSRVFGPNLTRRSVGTPGWIAPEAYMGEPITAQSDVYSFSMVLYELLTSKLPW